MKILYFGNNFAGLEILRWLKKKDEVIAGLVIHPQERQRLSEDIIASSELPDDKIFFADELDEPEVLQRIRSMSPDIGVSVFFGYILKKPLLDMFSKGCINLHPAYLPYNRGAYPNVWSIIDETPAGVTLHFIDEHVDTGDIIAQKQIAIETTDTGRSLYHKLESVSIDLFKDYWPLIKEGNYTRTPQKKGEGTYHQISDVNAVDQIGLEKKYSGKELINIIRARTFPPYSGAYITQNGKKIFLRLEFIPEDELSTGDKL